VSHIQPNFKLGSKLDEAVMTALKSYCYPFTISKSHLSTIGVQHTWPPVLAALSFLRVCIEVCYILSLSVIKFTCHHKVFGQHSVLVGCALCIVLLVYVEC